MINEKKFEGAFTVAGKGRKRKHRWEGVAGKVLAIRLSDTVNGILEARAAGRGLPKGIYARLILERELSRSHHKSSLVKERR